MIYMSSYLSTINFMKNIDKNSSIISPFLIANKFEVLCHGLWRLISNTQSHENILISFNANYFTCYIGKKIISNLNEQEAIDIVKRELYNGLSKLVNPNQ